MGFSLSEYEGLQTLQECPCHQVWRARRRADGAVLVLKRTKPESPTEEVLHLRREHALLSRLDVAGVVKSRGWEETGGDACLELEDIGGASLDHLAGAMPVPQFLDLAAGLVRALAGLHDRHVIHGAISPEHVVLNPETGAFRIIGFGAADQMPQGSFPIRPPAALGGALAYVSPEQTGRVNRGVDRRTDFYSLGATLYRLLTGRPPFQADDAPGLVHSHLAVTPVEPRALSPGIPPALSRLVAKLLAKMPEDRYQTAGGLLADLERCRRELAQGAVPDFEPALEDFPEQLQIPQKLYGRAAERARLFAAFERSRQGCHLLLLAGSAGVGKTALVRELYEPVLEKSGLFVEGKFDPLRRDLPYSGLVQAVEGLLSDMLGEPEAELARWRTALLAALGGRGKALAELFPSLERVIGPQPKVPALQGSEARNRINQLLLAFAQAIATPERPLVMFLDDLQWIDAASLDAVHILLSGGSAGMLVVGAYRDSMVDAAHPLSRRLVTMREEGLDVEEMALGNLPADAVDVLMADALHCDPVRARPLARTIETKTGGNPFFTLQTLRSLAEKGSLSFDAANRAWKWDRAALEQVELSGNVVSLMLERIRGLETPAQELLAMAACLGFQLDPAWLGDVASLSAQAVLEVLLPAVDDGLLMRAGRDLRFAHDRVREAVHSLSPPDRRAATHLRAARLLAERPAQERAAEQVFALADHYNLGASRVETREERDLAAESDLAAGRHALQATAWASAATYFAAVDRFLARERWREQYPLAFEAELGRGRCEFLLGELASAEERLSKLVGRAISLSDLAAVTRVLAPLYTTMEQIERAVAICLECLRRAGIDWPAHPAPEEAASEFERLRRHLAGREVEDLLGLPRLRDPEAVAVLEMLCALITPAFFSDVNLLALVAARMANLSIERGNSEASAYGYLVVGEILGSGMGDRPAGYRFGRLACDLVDRDGLETSRARIYVAFGGQISPWVQHARAGRRWLEQVFEAAMRVGDIEYACYAWIQQLTNSLLLGLPLEQAQREAEAGFGFAAKARFPLVRISLAGQLRFILAMRGLTAELGSFDGGGFDEESFERQLTEAPSIAITTCFYRIRKLQARFLAGDFQGAEALSEAAQRVLWTAQTYSIAAEFHFYSALARAALLGQTADEGRRRRLEEALAGHHAQLEAFARDCPENFASPAALVGAEVARLAGRDQEAMHLYERAIASAQKNGFAQNQAVSCELAAAFYKARGFDRIARSCLTESAACYARWGAAGKVRQLERLHPWLASARPGASSTLSERLDVAAVTGALRAISSEMHLDNLARALLRIAIENAGARVGHLWTASGAELRAVAGGGASQPIDFKPATAKRRDLPEAVFNHVSRSRETVLFEDAVADAGEFSADPYLRQARPRSLLCTPIQRKGALLGILYLENDLIAGAFTFERRRVVEMLAAQAAISLETAGVYQALEQSEARYRRIVETATEGVWVLGGDGLTTFVNSRMASMLGYGSEAMLGQSPANFMPEEDARDHRARMEKRRHGLTENYELRLLRKDGSLLWAQVSAAPILDDAGRPRGALAMLSDITERKRQEEEIRRFSQQLERRVAERTAELKQANQELESFSYSVSHDLRAPLCAIDGFAGLLARQNGRNLDEDGQRRLEAIRRNALRMGRLIDDLLDFSRSSRQSLESSRQDMTAMAREVFGELRAEQSGRSVVLRLEELPAARCDGRLVRQVWVNLLSNALKFTGSRAEASIEVDGWLSEAGFNTYRVRDNGVGFDMQSAEKLFGVFQRLHSQKDFAGTGIGLAIVKRIVSRHGGRVGAEGQVGQGACFFFTLPAA